MPPDELDTSVPEPWSQQPFAHADTLSQRRALGAPSPREVSILFWPRDEIPLAHEHWPELVEHTDTDSIVRDREMANRDLSQAGTVRISMVPLTVSALSQFAARTGSDPAEKSTRHACMKEIVNEGGAISWPPSRNAPCWCGSRTKYKKCCRRRDLG